MASNLETLSPIAVGDEKLPSPQLFQNILMLRVKGGGKLGHVGGLIVGVRLSMSSVKVRANWPAKMSHHGECDIDAERAE